MKYLTQYVPQGSGGISDGYVAVEENGVLKAQKLSFNGTEATPDGATEAIGNVGLFATGMDEPAYSGSETGGSAKFYKCASVDTVNKTWTGYELVLTDGVYVVSDVLTTGLTYAGFTPSVNTMYNENATFTIGQLFTPSETLEGCVFAANMQTTTATYNGETVNLEDITLADAPDYTDGTKALNKTSLSIPFDGASLLTSRNASVAFSAYIQFGSIGSSYTETFFALKNGDGSNVAYFTQYQSNGNLRGQGGMSMGKATSYGGSYGAGDLSAGWYHIVMISNYDTGNLYYYFNGSLYRSDSNPSGNISTATTIETNMTANGSYMKDLQIYNRVLTEDEIMSLYEKAKLPTA